MVSNKFKIPPDQYRKMLKELNLVKIRMIKNDCNLNLNEGEIEPVDIKEKTQLNQISANNVELLHSYKLTAKYKNSEETYIKLTATYQLIFIYNFDFNKEFFEIYKKISLPLNTFPFFREFVFSTTARMNIPPLTLPLVVL